MSGLCERLQQKIWSQDRGLCVQTALVSVFSLSRFGPGQTLPTNLGATPQPRGHRQAILCTVHKYRNMTSPPEAGNCVVGLRYGLNISFSPINALFNLDKVQSPCVSPCTPKSFKVGGTGIDQVRLCASSCTDLSQGAPR